MSLGETIRIVRQKAFYTQEAFANRIKVALSTVNRWEMGKARPNLRSLKEIKSFCEENDLSYLELEKEWFEFGDKEKGN